ncbi:VOC family protein [Paenibacillus sp. S-38]|uniref:VOC family protein n=1 Tax=Paenibacillus sp. S-38 TaxID=3416710 RepID=UPI003CE6B943
MGAQLTPFLMSEDARTQAEFYKSALGGEIRSLTTFGQVPGTPEAAKDKVMYMELALAGSNTLMMSDSFEPLVPGSPLSLSLTYDSEAEAREAFANLQQGGQMKYPFELQPWGAYFGEVVDRYGVLWQILKPVQQPAYAEQEG